METGKLIVHGALTQTANSAIQIAVGGTADRGTGAPGMLRYNSDTGNFEGFGTAWANVGGATGGTVTSVDFSSLSTGLTVVGNTITTSGAFTITLAGEIAGLHALATNGLVARTGTATYSPRTITASANAAAQGITVSNGDGVSANPTIGVTINGLSAASSILGTHTTAIYDGTNNVKATFGQVASYLDTALAYGAGSGLTLTGRSFSVNTTGASTGLAANNVIVRSTATSGQVLRSTGTAGAEAAWGALDLTNTNAVTGALGVANGGTGANSAAAARTALGVPSFFRTTFTNANLSAGLLTVTHNLGQKYVQVEIYDNTDKKVLPDEVTMTSTTVSTLDFTSYGTLTGTWNVVVIG